MAWTVPRQCSSRVPAGGEPDQIISRSDDDTLFILYSGNYVQVDATVTGGIVSADYKAVFSLSRALCGLNNSSGVSQWTCYTQHPGMTTIYFPAPSTPLAIVEVKVIAGGAPSSACECGLGSTPPSGRLGIRIPLPVYSPRPAAAGSNLPYGW
jgi:hypothetical protein